MCENPGISEKEWRLILKKQKDFTKISKERIKRSVAHGIPDRYRGQIWCLLCEYESESGKYDGSIYKKLLEMTSEQDEYNISKDVFRTIPESSKFKEPLESGQNKLYNVLKVYACYDNEIGYV